MRPRSERRSERGSFAGRGRALACCLALLGLATLSAAGPASSRPAGAAGPRAGIADFRVLLSSARTSVPVGTRVPVSISGERVSGAATSFLAVRIRVDDETSLTPGPGLGCAGSLPEITCDVGTAPFGPPGGSAPVSFRVTLGVTFATPGPHALSATLVVLEATDPDLTDNTASLTLRATSPGLAVSGVTVSPAWPQAGSTVVASVRVSTGGSSVRPQGIACSATVAKSRVRGAGRAASGTASCLFKTPRSARGKILTGTISFRAQGIRVSRRFAVRLGEGVVREAG